jgi:hypothetical protein
MLLGIWATSVPLHSRLPRSPESVNPIILSEIPNHLSKFWLASKNRNCPSAHWQMLPGFPRTLITFVAFNFGFPDSLVWYTSVQTTKVYTNLILLNIFGNWIGNVETARETACRCYREFGEHLPPFILGSLGHRNPSTQLPEMPITFWSFGSLQKTETARVPTDRFTRIPPHLDTICCVQIWGSGLPGIHLPK